MWPACPATDLSKQINKCTRPNGFWAKLTPRLIFTKMALQPFQFKQFSVAHDRSTHKVGTDAVLLGSWVGVQHTDRHILDIGTGSGVIALMLAQRTTNAAHIDALEIHQHDAEQARENVAMSPWPEKISVHAVAAQHFQSEKRYDLIVSNPPYFLKSLRPADQRRTTARHTLDLSFDDLLAVVTRLIAADGRFAVILPFTEGSRFITMAAGSGFFPRRMTYFRTRMHKPIERVLIEFAQIKRSTTASELTLYREDGQWSDEYRLLTGDFYIKAPAAQKLRF